MSLLGNVLWILLGGGLVLGFEYAAAGAVLCLTVIGIPFGVQCFKLALLALLPFGKRVERTGPLVSPLRTALNVLWIVLAGIPIVLTHLLFALICAILIVGIPFAKQHAKLARLALSPFGRQAT